MDEAALAQYYLTTKTVQEAVYDMWILQVKPVYSTH
jgi:hypothetical protein